MTDRIEFSSAGAVRKNRTILEPHEQLSDAARIKIARSALESVLFGLTNERNCVWPTPQAWTKKERDEAMLAIVRKALEEI
jgi:hypothetical protein